MDAPHLLDGPLSNGLAPVKTPAIHQLDISELCIAVAGIDVGDDGFPPGMRIVEIHSQCLRGLPVCADIGNGGKRGVLIAGQSNIAEDFAIVCAAALIPQILFRAELEPVEIAA